MEFSSFVCAVHFTNEEGTTSLLSHTSTQLVLDTETSIQCTRLKLQWGNTKKEKEKRNNIQIEDNIPYNLKIIYNLLIFINYFLHIIKILKN